MKQVADAQLIRAAHTAHRKATNLEPAGTVDAWQRFSGRKLSEQQQAKSSLSSWAAGWLSGAKEEAQLGAAAALQGSALLQDELGCPRISVEQAASDFGSWLAAHRPLIVEGALEGAAAAQFGWTLDSIIDQVGDQVIDVSIPDANGNLGQHSSISEWAASLKLAGHSKLISKHEEVMVRPPQTTMRMKDLIQVIG